MLETWAERPLTSSSLFFIPCTLPAFWWGLSHHIVELETIYPQLTLLRYQPLLPIPIVVLYLPPHTRTLSTQRIGWPELPYPPTPFGIGNKQHCCVDCRLSLSANSHIVWCSFSDVGFPFSEGSPAYPCYLAYHTKCFAVGPPFSSRQKNGAGLCLPPLKIWPHFICKACTVCAMMD